MPASEPGQIAAWLDAGLGAPVTRTAMVLETVLTDAPGVDMPALILADAALAQALGWDHLLSLMAPGPKRADLRKRGDDLAAACHRALITSAVETVRLNLIACVVVLRPRMFAPH